MIKAFMFFIKNGKLDNENWVKLRYPQNTRNEQDSYDLNMELLLINGVKWIKTEIPNVYDYIVKKYKYLATNDEIIDSFNGGNMYERDNNKPCVYEIDCKTWFKKMIFYLEK